MKVWVVVAVMWLSQDGPVEAPIVYEQSGKHLLSQYEGVPIFSYPSEARCLYNMERDAEVIARSYRQKSGRIPTRVQANCVEVDQ